MDEEKGTEKREGEIIQGGNAVLSWGSICHYNSDWAAARLLKPNAICTLSLALHPAFTNELTWFFHTYPPWKCKSVTEYLFDGDNGNGALLYLLSKCPACQKCVLLEVTWMFELLCAEFDSRKLFLNSSVKGGSSSVPTLNLSWRYAEQDFDFKACEPIDVQCAACTGVNHETSDAHTPRMETACVQIFARALRIFQWKRRSRFIFTICDKVIYVLCVKKHIRFWTCSFNYYMFL